MSTRLAARGHEVQVVTSTARDYLTWRSEYPAGTADDSGVEVLRLEPQFERDSRRFSHLDQRIAHIGRPAAPVAQADWLLLQGPILDGLAEVLAAPTDVSTFYTYLYPTTANGVTLASPFSPTVMHPTAHSEPQLDLQVFDQSFGHTDTFVVSTPDEAELMSVRTRGRSRIEVLGIGVDPINPGPGPTPVPSDRPYIALVGRVDPAKGSMEAIRYFSEFKRRHPGPLALAVVGHEASQIPGSEDIFTTGFVDEPTRDALMAGALALVQPSYFESFSLVLAEAWTAGVPALVQRNCPATAGQVGRSGGGLLYDDYASFEASLDLLLTSSQARESLGEAGRRYIADNYQWDNVVDRYESILMTTVDAVRPRLRRQPAPR